MIYFVIPAYDEAPNVERLFERLTPVAKELGARVVVVDDGSSDGTAELVLRHGTGVDLELVQHRENRGLGAAMRTGLETVLAQAGPDDPIVTMEADTTSDLGDLGAMLARFDEGYDVVLASVHAPGGRLIGVAGWRVFASKALSSCFRVLPGLRHIHTVSAVYRIYRPSALRRLSIQLGDGLIREAGFGVNAELLLKLADDGAKVCEVPTTNDWTTRGGESKLQTGKTLQAYGRLLAGHLSGRLYAPAASASFRGIQHL